jgi:hypothetical protein
MSGRLSVLGVLAVLAFVPALRADDYFEQKKKELAIQVQQTINDVTTALELSKQYEKSDPAKAKAVLNKALLDLNDSRALSGEDLQSLNKALTNRLKQIEAALGEKSKINDFNSKAKADKEIQAEKERLWKEQQANQGKSNYEQAKDRIDSTKKLTDEYKAINVTKNKNITDMALADSKLYADALKGEQRITEYFIKKSEARKPKLTKEEVALLKALNSTLTPDFDKGNTNFKNFLEYMSEKVPGLTIFVDEGSLKEANIEYDNPVGFKTKARVTVRTILKKVLGDLGLTYVIKDGAVQVITPERTRDYLVARAYPVQDLIAPFDMRMPPYAQKAQMFQQAQQLMQMIVNMVEPASWAGVGERGYGTIYYDPATMSIIIRHTAEMHYQLGGGLSR